jgi:hypothetical protein
MSKSISIKTLSGKVLNLRPVPMVRLPSKCNADWNKFQRQHVVGGALSDVDSNRLQAFMRANETEALTDGTYFFTVAGPGLAYCAPEAIV